jgi:hypothetical protein
MPNGPEADRAVVFSVSKLVNEDASEIKHYRANSSYSKLKGNKLGFAICPTTPLVSVRMPILNIK